MDTEQVREASWVVQSVTGASAYLYGVKYPTEKFKTELDRVVDHLREAEAATAGA